MAALQIRGAGRVGVMLTGIGLFASCLLSVTDEATRLKPSEDRAGCLNNLEKQVGVAEAVSLCSACPEESDHEE